VGSPPETGSFDSFFRDTMTKLGISVKTETDNATIGRTLTDQADQRRLSVSGVNTDEELSHMMQVQQAYQAASKLIKTADDMLQTLLQII
jgi:flagellar hook-associated protein 1 FlgK